MFQTSWELKIMQLKLYIIHKFKRITSINNVITGTRSMQNVEIITKLGSIGGEMKNIKISRVHQRKISECIATVTSLDHDAGALAVETLLAPNILNLADYSNSDIPGSCFLTDVLSELSPKLNSLIPSKSVSTSSSSTILRLDIDLEGMSELSLK